MTVVIRFRGVILRIIIQYLKKNYLKNRRTITTNNQFLSAPQLAINLESCLFQEQENTAPLLCSLNIFDTIFFLTSHSISPCFEVAAHMQLTSPSKKLEKITNV